MSAITPTGVVAFFCFSERTVNTSSERTEDKQTHKNSERTLKNPKEKSYENRHQPYP